jgi:hypothetical protein
MTFTLKPKFFLTGFIPGFILLFGIIILNYGCDFSLVDSFMQKITLFSGIVILISSFIIGQIIDSIRDAIDELIDKLRKNKTKKINWMFYFESEEEDIEKLDNNFYLFYTINFNIAICFFILLLFVLADSPICIATNLFIKKCWLAVSLVVSIFILVFDAILIRKYIVKITHTHKLN